MLATPLVHQFGPSSSTFIGCNPVPFQSPPAHCYHSTPSSSSSAPSGAKAPAASRIPRRSNQSPSHPTLTCCCHPTSPASPHQCGRGFPVSTSSVDGTPAGPSRTSPATPMLRRRPSMEFRSKGLPPSVPVLLSSSPEPKPKPAAGRSSPPQGNSAPLSPVGLPLSYGKRSAKPRSIRGVSASTPPVTTPPRAFTSSPPSPKSPPLRAKSPPPPRPPLPHLMKMPLPPLPPVPALSRAPPPPPLPLKSPSPPPSSPTPSSARRRKPANSSLLKKVILRRFAATEHGREIRRRGAHAGVLYLQTLAAARAFVVELDFACPGSPESGEFQNGYDYA